MKQLEAIWADSSTQWNFDFNHRNEIQSNMNNAFGAQVPLLFFVADAGTKKLVRSSLFFQASQIFVGKARE